MSLPRCPLCGRACDPSEDGEVVFCRAPKEECRYGLDMISVEDHRKLAEMAAKAKAWDEAEKLAAAHFGSPKRLETQLLKEARAAMVLEETAALTGACTVKVKPMTILMQRKNDQSCGSAPR